MSEPTDRVHPFDRLSGGGGVPATIPTMNSAPAVLAVGAVLGLTAILGGGWLGSKRESLWWGALAVAVVLAIVWDPLLLAAAVVMVALPALLSVFVEL